MDKLSENILFKVKSMYTMSFLHSSYSIDSTTKSKDVAL